MSESQSDAEGAQQRFCADVLPGLSILPHTIPPIMEESDQAHYQHDDEVPSRPTVTPAEASNEHRQPPLDNSDDTRAVFLEFQAEYIAEFCPENFFHIPTQSRVRSDEPSPQDYSDSDDSNDVMDQDPDHVESMDVDNSRPLEVPQTQVRASTRYEHRSVAENPLGQALVEVHCEKVELVHEHFDLPGAVRPHLLELDETARLTEVEELATAAQFRMQRTSSESPPIGVTITKELSEQTDPHSADLATVGAAPSPAPATQLPSEADERRLVAENSLGQALIEVHSEKVEQVHEHFELPGAVCPHLQLEAVSPHLLENETRLTGAEEFPPMDDAFTKELREQIDPHSADLGTVAAPSPPPSTQLPSESDQIIIICNSNLELSITNSAGVGAKASSNNTEESTSAALKEVGALKEAGAPKEAEAAADGSIVVDSGDSVNHTHPGAEL